MTLPAPKQKPANQSMLDRNREQEADAARKESTQLNTLQDTPVGRLSVSPIKQRTIDAFEDEFTKLKRQKRSLKRYDVIEALLQAFAEDQTVQAEVIKRLQ